MMIMFLVTLNMFKFKEKKKSKNMPSSDIYFLRLI